MEKGGEGRNQEIGIGIRIRIGGDGSLLYGQGSCSPRRRNGGRIFAYSVWPRTGGCFFLLLLLPAKQGQGHRSPANADGTRGLGLGLGLGGEGKAEDRDCGPEWRAAVEIRIRILITCLLVRVWGRGVVKI